MNSIKALEDVAAERARQITQEGWSAEHDDDHDGGALVEAAVCYASHAAARGWMFDRHPDEYRADRPFPADRTVFGHGDVTWPKGWAWSWWKPKDPRRDLVRAAALIIAEIERLDRASLQEPPKKCTCHPEAKVHYGNCPADPKLASPPKRLFQEIQKARLEWAMVCECPCLACSRLYGTISDIEEAAGLTTSAKEEAKDVL